MKHEWSGYREPNTANGMGESYITCDNCGTERHDENVDGECVPQEDASIVAPILPPYEG